MRIIIFSTAYLPFIGGAELAIKEITDRLGSSFPIPSCPRRGAEGGVVGGGIEGGVSFDLITLNLDRKQKREETLGDVRVIRLSCPKWWFPFRAFMTAAHLHRREPYTHIWSIMASYGGFAGLFFKYHFPNIPFILTLQEGDSFAHIYRRVFFVWPLFKMIFTRADRITAISIYLAQWARRMGATCPTEVIPNGVDIERFKIQDSRIKNEELRRKLGMEPEDKVVITASRLVPKNGVGDLIKSLRFLPENVKVLICGTGPLLKNLQLTTYNLQLAERVKFVGFVAHDELPRYLHAADIFCRPSLSEGLGISFLEAMAAGLPVVATPVGGIPDFLFDPSFTRPDSLRSDLRSEERSDLFPSGHYGQTGLFCRVGDPKDIAEKIQRFLSDNELRNRVVANASRMVREKYDWKGVAEQMKDVFDKSLDRV